MYQKFLNISSNLGFVDFGAARADYLSEEADFFNRYLASGCNAGMDYLGKNLDKRFDPSKLVEGARSVLVFLAPYSVQSSESGIASFAYGVDYHRIVKDRLFRFIEETGIEGRPFVDSAPVLERAWAVRAGLGFIGNNHFLISPEYGLRTIIGIIVTTLPFEQLDCQDLRFKRSKMPFDCGSCGRCTSSCPSGALGAGNMLDARKCISYCTIESKELYSEAPVPFKGSFFGCDRCLNVCPWNRLEIKGWPEFEQNKDRIEALSRDDWKAMTEEEFNETFENTSLSRAGIEKLKNSINFV